MSYASAPQRYWFVFPMHGGSKEDFERAVEPMGAVLATCGGYVNRLADAVMARFHIPAGRVVLCGHQHGACAALAAAMMRRVDPIALGNDYLMINGEGFSSSCQAAEYQGLHEVALDLSIWTEDLIDLDTHQPIEVKNGVIGEGLITSLDREGLPLIKYRLGDVIQIFSNSCECGYPGPGYRIKHLGRLNDRLFVEGVSVFPIAVRDIITSFIPRVTGAMRIVLTEPPPNITPPLKIQVEYGVGIQPNQLPDLAREIEEQMLKVYRVRSKVEFVPPEAPGRVTKKTPMFEERYPS